jgi:hypothetical protein
VALVTTATTFITTTEARLNLLPVSNGQLIFVRDSKRVCFDFQGERTEYGQIITLLDENHRLSIKSPFNTFYYVLDTNILWRYEKGEWITINPSAKENILFIGEEGLPEKGEMNVLYSTIDAIYRWDGEKYTRIGTLFWEEF